MDLFEYQARDLLASHGVPVLPGGVAETPEQAEAIAREIAGPVVVKAQVKTGGRGKAGGVKLASSPQEAADRAGEILGMDIKGHTVHRVMIAQGARKRCPRSTTSTANINASTSSATPHESVSGRNAHRIGGHPQRRGPQRRRATPDPAHGQRSAQAGPRGGHAGQAHPAFAQCPHARGRLTSHLHRATVPGACQISSHPARRPTGSS